MKKFLMMLISALLVVSLAIGVSAETIILGDVDGNGKVTASDARTALRIAAKLDSGTDKELAAADLDGNGSVSTSEARTILRMAALLEESLGTIEFGEESSSDEPATEEPGTTEPTTAEPTTEEPATAEPTTEEPATSDPTTEEPATEEPTTEEPATDEPATEEPTTEEPTTEEPTTEEPTTVEVPEGAVAYSEFPDEMKAFIEGKFGFSGTIDADGSSESVILKTDGKNIKMTTTMDMDSFGEYTISVIMVSSTNLLGRETTNTYIACDTTGKMMSLSTLQTAAALLGGGDLDLELNIEDFTIGIDEVDDSMYAYVTTETGDDGVEYTVYSVDATDSVVKFYFDGESISSIVTYDTDGNIDATFVIDEFYTDISDSDFDTSVYDSTSSLTTLFGISLLG